VVAEREAARERAERELAESRQAAITAAKLAALGEMSASVAHEVNNPLTAILLRAQRLDMLARTDTVDAAAVRKTAHDIDRTVDRIRRIVDALRAFARQGDEDPLRPERLAPIVADTVELSSHRFHLAGIELTVEPIPDTLLVLCRATQVTQVLLNLLSNAVKFTPEGGHVSVTCDAGDRAGTVAIHVADTGIGIAAAHLERVFEPFVQVGTPVSSDEGVGLGLWISRDLARAMGGELSVRSALGQGSTFTVVLPAAR